jgi:hypothetical protein
MNDHDKSNLEFLMSVTPETFEDWCSQVSEDDMAYAFELIRTAKAEVMCKFYELEDRVEITKEVFEYLNKYRINK